MKRITGFFLALLMLFFTPVCLTADGGFDGAKVEARAKKKSAGAARVGAGRRASAGRGSGRSERGRGGRASTRKERSSRGGRSSARAERGRASRGGRGSRAERETGGGRSAHHAGRHAKHGPDSVPKEAAKPAPPSPEQIEANARRESSYQTMARAYRLYDEGINARIAGDNGLAVSKLTESWKLFNDTRAYQRTGESSLSEALVHYELGQAAEGAGDYLTARDSYMRCLNIRPTFVDASVKLVNMLAMSGQWQMALAKAQDAARNNPNDPRVHQLMSLTLSKSGHPEEARHEAHKAQECLKYVPNYKPMGIDAVWKRTHHEDGSVKSGTSDSGSASEPSGGETESHGDTGKSDVDNPEDVMGVQEEPEEEE